MGDTSVYIYIYIYMSIPIYLCIHAAHTHTQRHLYIWYPPPPPKDPPFLGLRMNIIEEFVSNLGKVDTYVRFYVAT